MNRRPYVTVSFAQSLDGRLATMTGDSQWIGGEESLVLAHELRRDNDAILVGIGTVLRDNPRLTCRIPNGKNPIRIVLDRDLKISENSALFETIDEAPLWIAHRPDLEEARSSALKSKGAVLFPISTERNDLNLLELLSVLDQRGVKTLFVEGGARVITSFLKERLVDRWLAVTAPFLIGKGVEAVGDLGVQTLREALRPLRWRRWALGNDEATELIFRDRNP